MCAFRRQAGALIQVDGEAPACPSTPWGGSRLCGPGSGSLQHLVGDLEEHRPVHYPGIPQAVFLQHSLHELEPVGLVLLPERRQHHLVGHGLLHWPWQQITSFLWEPVHHAAKLHLLKVPGGRIGVTAAAGGPVSLPVLQVKVFFIPLEGRYLMVACSFKS